MVGLRGRLFLSPSSDDLRESDVDGLASATWTTTWVEAPGGLTISNSGSLGPCLVRLILRAGKCFFAAVATWMPKPVVSTAILR